MISGVFAFDSTYSGRGILTEASFRLVCDELLAGTVRTE
jgi:hypothetical protein